MHNSVILIHSAAKQAKTDIPQSTCGGEQETKAGYRLHVIVLLPFIDEEHIWSNLIIFSTK